MSKHYKEKQKLQLKKKKTKYRSNMIIGIFTLIIMVFSMLGFALMSGTAQDNRNGNSRRNLQNSGLRYYEDYGVWVSVLNGEQFVFSNIDKFRNKTNIEGIANKIKQVQNLKLYVDDSFDLSSLFLIEKSFKGLNLNYERVYSNSCDSENKLFLTNNFSVSGNCMIFVSNLNTTYEDSETLMYYLVK